MKITITKEFIKIGQLLKYTKIIDTGGQAKFFLEDNEVTINGEKVISKNTKARAGDIIWINNTKILEIE